MTRTDLPNRPGRFEYGSITAMLAAQVAANPNAVFVRTATGDLTYAEVETKAAALAGSLQRNGVQRNTTVALLMYNSAEQVVVWFALARLGAVHVPMNTALVGAQLEHVLRVSGAVMVVVDDDLRQQLERSLAGVESVHTLVVRRDSRTDAGCDADPARRVLELSTLMSADQQARVERGNDLDPATLLSPPAQPARRRHASSLIATSHVKARFTRISSDSVPTTRSIARSRSFISTRRH